MKNQTGMMLIEALVSLVIAAIALLGTVTLMAKSTRSEMESYQRVQALTLVQDMASRINANRQVASCYSNGASGLNTATPPLPVCALGTAVQSATANADLAAWQSALLGSREVSGSSKVGAMIGAVGCIDQVVPFDPNYPVYRVSVAWQGLMATAKPKLTCGKTPIGDNNLRRVISVQIQIANLTTT
ncbi:type IV pilus modification protein PilV [Rhodanobacter denitrificans]|uniref:Type IV pilus modification protein PilV n=1 Tax=Rhodanobacter denitrificans TaxID=666685 RepID=A0A368KHJ7_9GAMM|nr:type IV pilus modification protein PilV [Rhodanobacter denitrificans]RCS31380.1 type IV pilus modification protein PilV [Rhodanobacter denitrificans]